MFQKTNHLFQFGATVITVAAPETNSVQQWYKKHKDESPFPYWAKVWPASIALAQFINTNKELITNKHVMEVAAGLGLPSLLSATMAATVVCSDAAAPAVDFINESILLNGFTNITARIVDWNTDETPAGIDIILMSDVNYHPQHFPALLQFIEFNLSKKIIILLSTPQRIMAKPFITALEPYIEQQTEILVDTNIEQVVCSVLVLKHKTG